MLVEPALAQVAVKMGLEGGLTVLGGQLGVLGHDLGAVAHGKAVNLLVHRRFSFGSRLGDMREGAGWYVIRWFGDRRGRRPPRAPTAGEGKPVEPTSSRGRRSLRWVAAQGGLEACAAQVPIKSIECSERRLLRLSLAWPYERRTDSPMRAQ